MRFVVEKKYENYCMQFLLIKNIAHTEMLNSNKAVIFN